MVERGVFIVRQLGTALTRCLHGLEPVCTFCTVVAKGERTSAAALIDRTCLFRLIHSRLGAILAAHHGSDLT